MYLECFKKDTYQNGFTTIALLFLWFGFAQSHILPADVQIRTALYATPDAYKEDASVLGYNSKGELVTLKKGSNHLTCLADDPNKEGISVACYSKELDDFMRRGREVLAKGKTEKEKREVRKKEIEAEKLAMPKDPAIVYVVTANDEDLDKKTGELKKFHSMYKPYMTAESTGLPTKPEAPGMPWLMDAGTHRSHIMITPPRE